MSDEAARAVDAWDRYQRAYREREWLAVAIARDAVAGMLPTAEQRSTWAQLTAIIDGVAPPAPPH